MWVCHPECMCTWVRVVWGHLERPEEEIRFLDLVLQVIIVSHLTWLLAPKFGSSAKVASVLHAFLYSLHIKFYCIVRIMTFWVLLFLCFLKYGGLYSGMQRRCLNSSWVFLFFSGTVFKLCLQPQVSLALVRRRRPSADSVTYPVLHRLSRQCERVRNES